MQLPQYKQYQKNPILYIWECAVVIHTALPVNNVVQGDAVTAAKLGGGCTVRSSTNDLKPAAQSFTNVHS